MSLLAQTSTTPTTGVNLPTVVFSAMVWSALIFALVILVLPDQTQEQRSRIKAVTASGAGAALFFGIWAVQSQAANAALGTGGRPGGDLLEQYNWLTAFPITSTYHLDADGISLALILVTVVVFFCASLAVWSNVRRVKLLAVGLLTLETASLGVLVSYDWVLFLFFWTLPIVPLYLLVRGLGHGHRARGALRHGASLLISGGLLTLAATLIAFQSGNHSFNMAGTPISLPGAGAQVAFWLMTAAFLLPMGVVPLHGALLDIEEDSSGVLSAIFAAVLPSLGAYGLVNVVLGSFPTVTESYSLLFAALAVVTVVWAGLAAIRSDDLRQLVGHLGTVMMGVVLLGVAGHTTLSITGVTYLLVARGLAVALLMLLASGIQERTRRVRISQLGGLAWQAPFLSAFWLLAALSAAGVPLLAGFTANLFVFTGSFPTHRWATGVVMVAMFAAAGVLFWVAQRMFLGGAREGFARVRDLGPLELTYLGILAAVIVFMGILPGHFDQLFQNGAQHILFPGTG